MNSPVLKKLIELLDSPDQLKLVIDQSRSLKNLDSSILGFIAMYDSLNGDCEKMKQQLKENKSHIVSKGSLNKSINSRRLFLRYAAIFVVTIGGAMLVFYSMKEKQLELSTRYNEPGIPTYMSTTSSTNWSSIMFNFRKGNYSAAEKQLKQGLKLNSSNDTLIYYLSVTSYLQGKQDLGNTGFVQLSKAKGPYKAKSTYYLGLILVDQKKYSQALKVFKEVVNYSEDPVSVYAEKHVKEIASYLK